MDSIDSPALIRRAEHLEQYIDEQGTRDTARNGPMDQPPWPDPDNVMLDYLVERTEELIEEQGEMAALQWLAARAWFEGSLETMAQRGVSR